MVYDMHLSVSFALHKVLALELMLDVEAYAFVHNDGNFVWR